MLDPQDRRLLLESLRPPPGYGLDFAIGTTFTLDLLALLIAPLEFTVLNWKDDEGLPTSDPMALLESLRRNSDRIAIFCQAGAIAIPKKHQLLYAYLENSVFEMRPSQRGGVFHPKVWILRLTAPGQPVHYRVLVSTRNLTFDRCWDTLLVLDGQLTNRTRGFAENRALGDLVQALPTMARELPPRVTERLNQLQRELSLVRFDWPYWVEEGTFTYLGPSGRRHPPFPKGSRRTLTISPFLAKSALECLTAAEGEHSLISRLESLQRIAPETLKRFEKVWVLEERAHGAPTDEETSGDSAKGLPLTGDGFENFGLHAKLFVFEDGWNASVFTGSANATGAGFGLNVEFLVRLSGKKSQCGVDAVLGRGRPGMGLESILKEYEPSGQVVNELQETLDRQVEEARYAIASAKLSASVERSAGDEERYDVVLKGLTKDLLPSNVEAICWPISLPQDQWAMDLMNFEAIIFSSLSFASITSFFAFEVRAKEANASATVRFVLNLPLAGAPENRFSRLMSELLKDRSRLIQMILLLLAGDENEARDVLLETGSIDSNWAHRALVKELPLLEPMVKALHASPSRLDQVARLVADLRLSEEGRKLLPTGFDTVWEPIWKSRLAAKSHASTP